MARRGFKSRARRSGSTRRRTGGTYSRSRSSRTSRSFGSRRGSNPRQQTVRIVLEAPGQQSLPGSVQQIAAARQLAGMNVQMPRAGRPSTSKM